MGSEAQSRGADGPEADRAIDKGAQNSAAVSRPFVSIAAQRVQHPPPDTLGDGAFFLQDW
jgi:hypothetical protein